MFMERSSKGNSYSDRSVRRREQVSGFHCTDEIISWNLREKSQISELYKVSTCFDYVSLKGSPTFLNFLKFPLVLTMLV